MFLSSFSESISSYPSSNSFGISLTKREIALQLVDPNIVLCLAHVKNRWNTQECCSQMERDEKTKQYGMVK